MHIDCKGYFNFSSMGNLVKILFFVFVFSFLVLACANQEGQPILYKKANANTINIIDSSKTNFLEYAYDEQYYFETFYYDSSGQLLKTVKYDNLARSVIYNVSNKNAALLKATDVY